nr:uncharacterized protein LOC124814793 [Hydra vulgaris]
MHQLSVSKKSFTVRSISINMSTNVSKYYNKSVPVGFVFCHNHLKSERILNQTKTSTAANEELVEDTTDFDFEPEEILLSGEKVEDATFTGNSLSEALHISPFQFQIKNKKISDLSNGTKNNLRRKFERAKVHLEKRFAEAVAPDQSEDFISIVLKRSLEASDNDVVPDELKKLVEIYEESDFIGKHIVQCLIEHEKFTKKLLMKVFGCSKYKIDQVRKIKNANKGITIPVENSLYKIYI